MDHEYAPDALLFALIALCEVKMKMADALYTINRRKGVAFCERYTSWSNYEYEVRTLYHYLCGVRDEGVPTGAIRVVLMSKARELANAENKGAPQRTEIKHQLGEELLLLLGFEGEKQ